MKPSQKSSGKLGRGRGIVGRLRVLELTNILTVSFHSSPVILLTAKLPASSSQSWIQITPPHQQIVSQLHTNPYSIAQTRSHTCSCRARVLGPTVYVNNPL